MKVGSMDGLLACNGLACFSWISMTLTAAETKKGALFGDWNRHHTVVIGVELFQPFAKVGSTSFMFDLLSLYGRR